MRRFRFWAVGLALLAIVAFNVQGWIVLSRTSRAIEQALGDRLQAVATTLATALEGEFDSERSQYLLPHVMRDNRLFNLFVVNDRLEYLVNLGHPELVGRSDPALELDMAEVLTAFSGIPTQSTLYRAGASYLKTAYAPLRDRNGTVGAALGVEADAGFFATLAGFRRTLVFINVISLLAIVAIVLVSASMARHALKVEQAASRANTLAMMGQMSAAVAHEIKNPLGIIRASAERLKTKYGTGPEAQQDPTFDYIQEEVDRLAGVVSNYLGLGRYRPGEIELLDLGEVVQGVVDDLGHQAGKAGVGLQVSMVAGLQVSGNRNELRQVFLNLVLNAIQAQAGGGRVEIAASRERRRGRDRVVVRVRDSGPGMDRRQLSRAFEPFFTTREKGSGLGLFVVKRLVEAHRGRVNIRSRPGEGTTVEVRLPA